MHTYTRTAAALLGTAALALPSTALAKPGHGHGHGYGRAGAPGQVQAQSHGKGKSKAKGKARVTNVVLKGTVVSVDTTAGTATVTVTGGNRAGRDQFAGQTVTVSLAQARLTVADTDGDGTPNELADVKAGDLVVVQVRLAQDADTSQPLPARQLTDEGPAPAPDAASGEATQTQPQPSQV